MRQFEGCGMLSSGGSSIGRVGFGGGGLQVSEGGWDGVAFLISYYPLEVNSMKYCCLGVFRKEYFRLVTKQCK